MKKYRRMHKMLFWMIVLIITLLCESIQMKSIPPPIHNMTWYPCPLRSVALHEDAHTSIMAECTVVSLPLDYNNIDTSAMIQIFVKRLTQKHTMDVTRSLWLLGEQTSTQFENTMLQLSSRLPNYDIYTLDHRGTGYSSRIQCLTSQSETTGSDQGVYVSDNELHECSTEFKLRYGTNTDKFSPTGAAWDLASLIYTTNELYDYEAVVYGLGYGTLWLTRLIQLSNSNGWNENLALYRAVVMDSVMSTSSGSKNPDLNQRWQLSNLDTNMNEIGIHLLNQYCANHTICFDKLNGNPVQFLHDTFNSLYINGTCKKITKRLTEGNLRIILGNLLLGRHTIELIPALLYRLKRCNGDIDIPTINYFLDIALNTTETLSCPPLESPLLRDNIIYSELWPRDLSLATSSKLIAEFNTTFMASGIYRAAQRLETSQFPIYTPDNYFNRAQVTDVPTLLLNGDLDPITTIASARNQTMNLGLQNTRLIEIKHTTHGTIFHSNHPRNSTSCGMEILISFLNSRDVAIVDTRCLNNLEPINFAGNSIVNNYYFGVDSIFEGTYEPADVQPYVNLYLFIGIEAVTVVAAFIIIACLFQYSMKFGKNEFASIQQQQ
jgi:pimeloyl-ACP methyl ester carboxylesterase